MLLLEAFVTRARLMDPVTIFGAVSSTVGLVDGVAKTVDRIITLKTTWQIADLSVNLLLGQLCTVKAALIRLSQITVQSTACFSEDVSLTLASCSELLVLLDGKLSKLEKDSQGHLPTSSKARVLWDKTETCLYQQFLDKAINALNLCLTVATQ